MIVHDDGLKCRQRAALYYIISQLLKSSYWSNSSRTTVVSVQFYLVSSIFSIFLRKKNGSNVKVYSTNVVNPVKTFKGQPKNIFNRVICWQTLILDYTESKEYRKHSVNSLVSFGGFSLKLLVDYPRHVCPLQFIGFVDALYHQIKS